VSELGVLDRSALDALMETMGGDADFFAEMIDIFLVDAEDLLSAMVGALANGDASALRRAVHTLKSNSRTFGASALADLCQDIEGHAAAGTLDGLAPLVEQVVASYPDVAAALRAERPDA
jgi:HPt (histidine-containing phosphotransfer) domain-containing protein